MQDGGLVVLQEQDWYWENWELGQYIYLNLYVLTSSMILAVCLRGSIQSVFLLIFVVIRTKRTLPVQRGGVNHRYVTI